MDSSDVLKYNEVVQAVAFGMFGGPYLAPTSVWRGYGGDTAWFLIDLPSMTSAAAAVAT